ncbi:MAG TPA: S8 family serine peptidase [Thermoleophilaceae bacterium]|nr:S8 family serine peptidase [Thermoleophilaceae bacterium]
MTGHLRNRRPAPPAAPRRAGRPRLAGAAVVLALLPPAPALAEQPAVTSQARTANAAFLAYAPPPPGGAVSVCLVDTGVDPNPDTEHAIVLRDAMDGGDPGDGGPTKHGTSMAMTMAGPENGWGSVGAWPHVRIVSIRASAPGETYFPFSAYRLALERCRKRAAATGIAVANLSLGGVGASSGEVELLSEQIDKARNSGMNVVAAAGNGGGPVELPAAVPGAFAVGGVDATFSACSFSASGPGVDILSQACGLDVATPEGRAARGDGTSDGAAFTSALIGALRSHRPGLGVSEAESALVSTARQTASGAVVDAEAAFRALGLGHVVDAGNARLTERERHTETAGAPLPAPAPGEPASVSTESAKPPRPLLRIRLGRNGTLALRIRNRRPDDAVLVAVTERVNRAEFGLRRRVLRRNADSLQLRMRSARWRIVIRLESAAGRGPGVVLNDQRRRTVRKSTRRSPKGRRSGQG